MWHCCRHTGWLVVVVMACVWLWPGASVLVADEETPTSPLDSTLREQILTRAEGLPRLRSLLISVEGELVEERYYHGAAEGRLANLKSASKSIISILIGIAIDVGHITGITQPVADFFPGVFGRFDDPIKSTITIEDLLTMRSGLETTSNRNYGRWVQSPNWVRHVLSRPLVDRPGGRMIYSTGSTHLLSAIITEATGMSTLEFSRQHLAQPLGIALPAWLRDPQGVYFGGNEMQLRPRDMLRIGQLYLNCGMFEGRQIVSEEWVHASLQPRTRSQFSGREYGYGWWMRSLVRHEVYYAWGYGGQFIFVVPDLQLVVAITSSPNPGQGRRQHLSALYGLVENQVIPGVERARPTQ